MDATQRHIKSLTDFVRPKWFSNVGQVFFVSNSLLDCNFLSTTELRRMMHRKYEMENNAAETFETRIDSIFENELVLKYC